jgi:uncharacterized membrane protein YhiD involved in acid resistance
MSNPMKSVGWFPSSNEAKERTTLVASHGGDTTTAELIDDVINKRQESSIHKIMVKLCSALFVGLMFTYTFVIMFGETWLLPPDYIDWCQAAQQGYPEPKRHYPNPDSNNNPCYYERTLYLLGMNQFESTFSRRMIVAVILGAAIGFERKAADRPAGVRTMSLVSLGSCFFTMCGQHAFRSSPQEFDAARVSAAIPSGVGFLGSALIWKHANAQGKSHEVHGLTTAASVWLSASIGIGSGGGLFLLSAYATALVIFVLRIGPRIFFADDASSVGDDEDEWETDQWESTDADDKEGEDETMPREEQPELPQQRASSIGPQLVRQPSSRRSIHNGGLTRRKSRASIVTFGS